MKTVTLPLSLMALGPSASTTQRGCGRRGAAARYTGDGTLLCCIVTGTTLYSIVLYSIALYCNVLYLLYYSVLYCNVLLFIVFSSVLYYTVHFLYYAVPVKYVAREEIQTVTCKCTILYL